MSPNPSSRAQHSIARICCDSTLRPQGRASIANSLKLVLTLGLLVLLALVVEPARAQDQDPFAKFMGRWVGEGRLGIRNGSTEQVKCRVTYTKGEVARQVQQSIRCASAAGSIEVKSEVSHNGEELSGTWKELVHDLQGNVSGKVTDKGLRVRVSGQGMTANMTIILRDGRQIIEIQFIDSALIGLTLWLTQG